MTQTAAAPAPAAVATSRWAKLIVLCAGMLMIILDQTITTVALPSIQSDLHFSQSNLAWVVNAYLIAFGGLLLLAGRLGDLIGRRNMFIGGPRRVRRIVAALRPRRQRGDADRRPLRPGRRRRDDVGRDPRDDRRAVPEAGRAGARDRRLQLRLGGRRVARAAGRRRADRDAELALDLLRQPPDRAGDRLRRTAAARPRAGPRARPRRRRRGRSADHQRADARRLHDPPVGRPRLGHATDAGPVGGDRSRCSPRSAGASSAPATRCCRSPSCAIAT